MRLRGAQLAADPVVPLLMLSEEAQKVLRNSGKTFLHVYRKAAAAGGHGQHGGGGGGGAAAQLRGEGSAAAGGAR